MIPTLTTEAPTEPLTVEQIESSLEDLLSQGNLMAAYDLAHEGLRKFPDRPKLRVLAARTLVEAQAHEQALQVLAALTDYGEEQDEADGMFARMYKALWVENGDSDAGIKSRDLYAKAYAAHHTIWTGINAATLSALLGDEESATDLAKRVAAQCAAEPQQDYWTLATLGEAALLMHDHKSAAAYFQAAAGLSTVKPAHIASTRRQLELMSRHGVNIPAEVWQAMQSTGLVLLSAGGAHQSVDWTKVSACFLTLESRESIATLREAVAAGTTVCVVLPCDSADYLQSMSPHLGAEPAELSQLLDAATSVKTVTTAPMLGDPQVLASARCFASGLARIHADWLATDVLESGQTPLPTLNLASHHKRVSKTFLFADVVGYSKLPEHCQPAFVATALQPIVDALGQPVFVNTAGDGLFIAMDDATSLAAYAIGIVKVFKETDWVAAGLPHNLDIRLGLHSGPAFEITDPFTSKLNLYGIEVNRTARLEPVTIPGQVFATEQFAALLAHEQALKPSDQQFGIHFLGKLDLAKLFGKQYAFRLSPPGGG